MSAGGMGPQGMPSSSAAMAGPDALGGASGANGAMGGAPGFNYMSLMPMLGSMGQQQMGRAQQQPVQPMSNLPSLMAAAQAMRPQGSSNLPKPDFPNMAPPKSPVQVIAGQAIQNMDPASFYALINGFRSGLRR